mmetsp:Transcript_2032/g.2768  ORF Transcript_2032/g.2768 Transcript_2032/m.2768 type:complete len:114 (-) Transcript_2032:47-388(-)
MEELGELQRCTTTTESSSSTTESTESSSSLDGDQYVMVCRCLGCHPNRGISVEALRLTYASDGTDLEKDYATVFPERKRVDTTNDGETNNKNETNVKDDDEKVYEIGQDGYEI